MILAQACAKHDIPPAQAALRWLTHHSILDPASGDGIIIGASTVAHIHANLKSIDIGEPLPEDLLTAYDEAWAIAKPFAPGYFRGYSALPGASTDFIKTFQPTVPNSFP